MYLYNPLFENIKKGIDIVKDKKENESRSDSLERKKPGCLNILVKINFVVY